MPSAPPVSQTPGSRKRGREGMTVGQVNRPIQPPQTLHPQPHPMPALPTVDPLAQNPFPYQVYGPPPMHAPPRGMHPPPGAPPQTWQAANGIAPQQTHIAPPHLIHRPPYRDDAWEGYDHTTHPGDAMGGPAATSYDYRYRDDQTSWSGPNTYYDPSVSPISSAVMLEY